MENPIDILDFLSKIVEENTQHYRSDFTYDEKTLWQAAQEPNMEDRVFYWMSRPAGTWCVKEREAFLRGSSAHSIWTHYADEPEQIKAYRITITGRKDGRVMGLAVPLDYREQVRRVQRNALPADTVTIQYESGHAVTVSCQEHPKKLAAVLPGDGGVQNIRYAPKSEAELARVIMEEHRWQAGTVKRAATKRRRYPGR